MNVLKISINKMSKINKLIGNEFMLETIQYHVINKLNLQFDKNTVNRVLGFLDIKLLELDDSSVALVILAFKNNVYFNFECLKIDKWYITDVFIVEADEFEKNGNFHPEFGVDFKNDEAITKFLINDNVNKKLILLELDYLLLKCRKYKIPSEVNAKINLN